MLSEGEYEEFQRIIHNSKYSPDDFEISTIDYIDKCEHLYSGFTKVSIRYIPNNVTRTYLSGIASSWLRNLEDDIEEGVYGQNGSG